MLTLSELQRLSQLDFADIDETQLVDIRNINLDPDAPAEERLSKFIAEVGNPYLFRVGKVPVRAVFSQEGKTLDNAIKNHFLNARKALSIYHSML